MTGLMIPPTPWSDIAAIGVGAFLGAISRYQIGRIVTEYIITSNPQKNYQRFTGWHTAAINVGGSFLLGGVAASPVSDLSSSNSVDLRAANKVNQVNSPVSRPDIGLPRRRPTGPHPSSKSLSTQQSPLFRFEQLSSFRLTPRTKLLLGVGFCGSFTTFSTFSVDVVNWIQKGETRTAIAYVLANNVGGIAAAAVGMAIVKKVCRL